MKGIRSTPARRWATVLVLLPLLALGAARAEEAAPEEREPEELDTVPVDMEDPSEALLGMPLLEWGLSSNLQWDTLASSDLPADREKSNELRRARLSGLLEWNFDWILKAGGDFSDGPELRELSLEYRGWPVYVEIGRIPEPFGMLQGGSRYAPLMERPNAYALATGYGIGLAANARGDRWSFTAGAYKATKNSPLDEGGRKENAFTLRGTFMPLKGEDKMIHLGFAGSYREAAEGFLQFVAIPESVLLLGLNASSSILFADPETSNRYYLYGVEFASQFGPVVIKSEYMQAHLPEVVAFDENTGTTTSAEPLYFSYYFEIAGALTGERRDYSTRRGALGGLYPSSSLAQGGIGAVELAARFSHAMLEDTGTSGEQGIVFSGGLNWYPASEVKVMVDALQIEEITFLRSEDAFAVQARLQANFSLPY